MRIQNGSLSRKAGKWRVHYSRWIVDPATGAKQREQKCVTLEADIKTKTQANEEKRKILVRELGLNAEGSITVKGLIVGRWQPLKEGRWRPSTAQTNKELLARITERFGDVPLRKVDNVNLQLWLNALAKTHSGSVVKHCRLFLKSIFAEAIGQRYLDIDPARNLIVPKLKVVPKPYLTMEQLTALLANAGTHRDITLLRVLFLTGMRPSELLALRWRDVNLSEGTLTLSSTVYRGKLRDFTKTTEEGEKPRQLLPAGAVEALTQWHAVQWDLPEKERHNGADDFVFPAPDGNFWWKENYQRRVLAEIAKRAEVPRVNFQIIRRSVGTWVNALGSMKDAQAVLRHRKVETTANIYAQAVDETVRATLDKFDAKLNPVTVQ
jgi:integrase